jgi:hypothetical protein
MSRIARQVMSRITRQVMSRIARQGTSRVARPCLTWFDNAHRWAGLFVTRACTIRTLTVTVGASSLLGFWIWRIRRLTVRRRSTLREELRRQSKRRPDCGFAASFAFTAVVPTAYRYGSIRVATHDQRPVSTAVHRAPRAPRANPQCLRLAAGIRQPAQNKVNADTARHTGYSSCNKKQIGSLSELS